MRGHGRAAALRQGTAHVPGKQPRMRFSRDLVSWIGLGAGLPAAWLVFLLLPETFVDAEGTVVAFTASGRATAAVGVLMAIWWMTEALPLYATALLPLAMFPLAGVSSIDAAAAPYGNELIFLFLGGFVLALSMERWGLHNRIAFLTLQLVGTRAERIVAAFMALTAVLSMWVSNTATVIIMLPIATSILALLRDDSGSFGERQRLNLGRGLLLGIAYAASIGGLGTLIGTPPNLFLASFAKSSLGIEIGFARWMAVGLPLVVVFLPLAWWLLTHVLYPVNGLEVPLEKRFAREAYRRLGPPSLGEKVTFVVFLLTALGWITRPLLNRWGPLAGLTDTSIAILAALVLFAFPVSVRKRRFVMNWDTAVRLPWGILLLFGGGLSLAAAIRTHGVAEFLGAQAGALAGLPSVVIVVAVVAGIVFLTELTSNTATAAALLPVLAAVAPVLGLPVLLLVVPAAVATSCAFMLPVATPPNAIVFGSGRVAPGDMAHAGLWLNLTAVVLITLLGYTLVLRVLG